MTDWVQIIIIAVVLVSAVAASIVFLSRKERGSSSRPAGGGLTDEILKMKYASGLLNKEEYEEQKRDVEYYNNLSSSYSSVRLRRVL
jgi:uncharacterized membrane protein